MSNENLTVPELRAAISAHPRVVSGDMPMSGLSKVRKPELLSLLDFLLHSVPKRRAPKANKERRPRAKGSRVGRRFGTKARSNRQDPRNIHHKAA